MNVATTKTQLHRYREQTSGYQWGEGKGKGQDIGGGLQGANYHGQNKETIAIYCTVQGI